MEQYEIGERVVLIVVIPVVKMLDGSVWRCCLSVG